MPRARLVFDGDGVYTEKEARIHKLTQETETKIDNIPGVVDDVNSTSTTDALSANMGKRLQDQINQLTGLNKFLSTWDCTTGLPVTDPSATPFTYTSGNYYLVATVAGEGGTNYKPHGSTFTPGVASSAVETNEVNVNDMYIFDGSQWILQINKVKEIIVDDGLSPTSTNAVENRAIYSALTTKQNKILDLADIRAGATKGATSIQPGDNITELTNNAGYQTAGDVAVTVQEAIEELAPEGVGAGVLTLQKNNTTIDTFSANAAQNKTINISIPTTVAELTDANDYATKDYVDGNVIHSGGTAPSPAEEGMLWYDTTNDVLKVYDGTQWNLTGKVYSSGTGINVNNTNDTISNTGVLSVNGSTGDITGVATEQYVDNAIDEAVEDSKYVGPTAPSNPTEGMLWYDTTNDVLKVYDGANRITLQELLINGVSIKTVNNHNLLGSGNIDIIGVEEIQFVTQAEYDALPSSKTSDGKAYFIYSGHGAAIVSDEAYGSTWDGITTQAPSKNAVYDEFENKQDILVSGDNIKTINNESILGSGNITVEGQTYTAGPGIIIGDYSDYTAMRGPCPEGYHIPTHDEFWNGIVAMGVNIGAWTIVGGWQDFTTYLKLPSGPGFLDYVYGGGYYYQYGGRYWLSSRKNTTGYPGSVFGARGDDIADEYSWVMYGYSIRPFKDVPVVPDNTRTTLYSSNLGSIKHSQSLGLITISYNGTYITIADKNLGASQVWNYGNTYSEANSGGFFQRGNNYMFPFSGTQNNSTTKVNAGTYGPGNYYSSSTFIYSNSSPYNWDTSNNLNLWGGETGVVTLDNTISVDKDVIKNISISASSFGGFVKSCQASGTRHSTRIYHDGSSSGGGTTDVTYTFKGIGWFDVEQIHGATSLAAVDVNGVTIFAEQQGSGTYTEKSFRFITMGPGDTVRFMAGGQYGASSLLAFTYDFY